MLIEMLVMGLALAMVTITALPGMAEAQSVDGPSTVEQNNSQNNEENTSAATATATRHAPETGAEHRVVSPGESLWSIAQERLGPNVAPKQVADEVERIYLSNRDRIGGDPNLLRDGQELSLPPAAAVKPAPNEPVPERLSLRAAEPEAAELEAAEPKVAEPVSLPELPQNPTEVVAVSAKDPTPVAEQNADARRTAGYVVLLGTFAITVLGMRRLLAERH